jgi:hypothetical protein
MKSQASDNTGFLSGMGEVSIIIGKDTCCL